ncbi:hypothetical protein K466DRAFT_225906 [Polyporus arcularius HHB13444]|uniref:Uncharacterized protein n=1 Tax=Polyporus arcularius HHB13444 TaxID=1314778 RepID=A0A5C3P4N2_9APHY|nr:hypothetical protein K466DRAFT_225906 [Polyporus arcularius HHB13444]
MRGTIFLSGYLSPAHIGATGQVTISLMRRKGRLHHLRDIWFDGGLMENGKHLSCSVTLGRDTDPVSPRQRCGMEMVVWRHLHLARDLCN